MVLAVTDWTCLIRAFVKVNPEEGSSYCAIKDEAGKHVECEGCPSRQAKAIREKGSVQ